ncbi:MAG: HNH endonuclease [Candidatus Limnocylindria bacterium]
MASPAGVGAALTGVGPTASEVDHILPRARGGGDEGNLQSLCHPCHAAKSAQERAHARSEGAFLSASAGRAGRWLGDAP